MTPGTAIGEGTAMKLRYRLTRLEQARVPTSARSYVVLDERGLIRDDGSDDTRPWIGRPYTELTEALPKGTPLKVYLFDPRTEPGA